MGIMTPPPQARIVMIRVCLVRGLCLLFSTCPPPLPFCILHHHFFPPVLHLSRCIVIGELRHYIYISYGFNVTLHLFCTVIIVRTSFFLVGSCSVWIHPYIRLTRFHNRLAGGAASPAVDAVSHTCLNGPGQHGELGRVTSVI